jgi:derlin-1
MDAQNWFKSLPIFTRYWFGLTVALTLVGKIGIVSPYYLILTEDFIKKFQIWRPVTALFFYPLTPQTGFHFLTNLYFLYTYSIRLETGHFVGKPADYLFMLIFNWATLGLIGYFSSAMLLMDPMVMSVLYVWCQLNKDTTVNFWFGTQFKAYLLPWVLLAFNVVIQGGGFFELLGILVGHLYFFLTIKYPTDFGGPALLTTPSILYSYFPSVAGRGGISGTSYTGNVRVPRSAARGSAPGHTGPLPHSWGTGNHLGGN